jgi:hypothetical protein
MQLPGQVAFACTVGAGVEAAKFIEPADSSHHIPAQPASHRHVELLTHEPWFEQLSAQDPVVPGSLRLHMLPNQPGSQ